MHESQRLTRRQRWARFLFPASIVLIVIGLFSGIINLVAISDSPATYQREIGVPSVWISAGIGCAGLVANYPATFLSRRPEAR